MIPSEQACPGGDYDKYLSRPPRSIAVVPPSHCLVRTLEEPQHSTSLVNTSTESGVVDDLQRLNMTPTNQPSKSKYLRIKEGLGGTFAFGSDHDPKAFGTYHCWTCVGFCIAVEGDRAFIVHVRAVKPLNGDWPPIISTAEGKRLKASVITKLQKHAAANNWDPSKADRDTAIMVCPSPDDLNENLVGKIFQKKAGAWVVEAIQEFFDLPPEMQVDRDHHGFIVNFQTGERVRAKYQSMEQLCIQGNDQPEELNAYEAETRPGIGCEWRFVVI